MGAFREWLVGAAVLGQIRDIFEGRGFQEIDVPQERLPNGQRRQLIERYYAGVDLTSPDQAKRLLALFEDVLIDIPSDRSDDREKLLKQLERDGFKYLEGRLLSERLDRAALKAIGRSDIDTEHLEVYLQRIGQAVSDDPSLAIGTAKELVEATIKTILRAKSVEYEESEDIPKLLKRVQKALALAPEGVADTAKGAETIRRLLNNLGSVVVGVAELRNLYGSGHGRSGSVKGLTPRHARLVVTAAGAICTFLLETYDVKTPAGA